MSTHHDSKRICHPHYGFEFPAEETWRDVPGWEKLYQVSTKGRVKALFRTIMRKNGLSQTVREKIKKLCINSDGYAETNFWRNGKGKITHVQRLVLLTFVGPCPKGMEACHANGNRKDNKLENLRWDTRAGNIRDTMRHNRVPKGRRHWNSKLTETKVRNIRKKKGIIRIRTLAKKYDVSPETIARVLRSKTWRHVTC